MSSFLKLVLSTFLLLELFLSSDGRTDIPGVCTGMTPCYCKFNNGQFLDLSGLGKTDGTPRFLNVTDSHEMTYSWNPCFGFTEGACQNVSVCAIRPAFPDNIFAPIGYHNTSAFQTDTTQGTITLKYTTAGDGKIPTKSSYISLVCEHTALDKHTLKALGPKTQTSLDYYFELRGALACPQGNANTTPKPSSSGLSSAAKGGIIGTAVAIVIGGVVITLIVLRRRGKICQPKYDEL